MRVCVFLCICDIVALRQRAFAARDEGKPGTANVIRQEQRSDLFALCMCGGGGEGGAECVCVCVRARAFCLQ